MTKQPSVAQATSQAVIDTPQTFGAAFKITPQCVRNYVHQGRIPCIINSGKIIRFYRAEALEALNAKGKGHAK